MKDNGREYFDLSVAQRELSMANFPTDKSDLVNMLGFRSYVKEDCDLKLLERCWNRCLEKHDALRLRIEGNFIKRRQYFEPYRYETLPIVTVNGFEGLLELEKKERSRAVRMFDGPLYRVVLADCGNGTGGMIACIHNIVCDGYSLELLFKDMEDLYALGLKGEEFPPYKQRSYVDYLKLEKKYMDGPARKTDHEWWKNIYRSLDHYSIPLRRPSRKVKTEMIISELRGDDYDRLTDLAVKLSVTTSSIVMMAMALTTWKMKQKKCFCFYNLSHGRRTVAMKQTVGCITAANPIFFRIDPDLSIAETIQKEYMSYLEELQHGRLPCLTHFLMGYWWNLKNGLNFCDNWMFYSPMGLADLSSESRLGLVCFDESELENHFYTAVYDIPHEKTFRLEMNYQIHRFTRAQMEEVKAVYEALILACLEHPENSVRSLQ